MARTHYTIEDAHAHAARHGGRCLSSELPRAKAVLSWECGGCGRQWDGMFLQMHTSDSWCKSCGAKRHTLDELQAAAKVRGGACLSERFLGMKKRHRWRCGTCGGQWDATPGNVIDNGSWCPYCAGLMRQSLGDLHKLADENGSLCLSETYLGADTPHDWKCGTCCHTWSARPAKQRYKVKKGVAFCPRCAVQAVGRQISITEDVARQRAEKAGLTLVQYAGKASANSRMRCQDGHEFEANLENIYFNRSGCPYCKSSLGERTTRDAFQWLFDAPFPAQRPDWLRDTKTNRPLELDGYNEDRALAFEYQGWHHREPVYGEDQLEEVRRRDRLKVDLCCRRGVTLIVVPEFAPTGMQTGEDILAVIVPCLVDAGVPLPAELDYTEYMPRAVADSRFAEILDRVQEKGGSTNLQSFAGVNAKFEIICAQGHTFQSSYRSLFRHGYWCQKCYGQLVGDRCRHTIDDMRALAAQKGIDVVSTVYGHSTEHLEWRCPSGHIFEATPTQIRQGRQCPECRIAAQRRDWRQRCDKIICEKAGERLSEYGNQVAPIDVRCGSCREIWSPKPSTILRGTWCPHRCGSNEKVDKIEDCRRIAASNGGECLEQVFVNHTKRMLWRCGDCGHEWRTSFANIKKGTWCPNRRYNRCPPK